jgi:endonuclease/exonuclease/phosphatase family metal-dependent hydrolase
MTIFLTVLLTLAVMFLSSTRASAQSNGANGANGPHLFESGKAGKLVESGPANELKIVSYNIRWRSGDELQQIIRWVKEAANSGPIIIGLQEVDREKKRSAMMNHPRTIAEGLGMHYVWASPEATKSKTPEAETGVAILSPYPLTEVTRILLPHPGPGGRRRAAIGATANLSETPLAAGGSRKIRVYSVHSEVRLAIGKKIDQLRAVLDDLQKYPKDMPAIVLGDFNTWESPAVGRTRDLFSDAGFTTPFPDDETTFRDKFVMFEVKFKLDWIWVRGLTPLSYGIDRKLTVSDHFPLWTVVQFPDPAKTDSDIPETQ